MEQGWYSLRERLGLEAHCAMLGCRQIHRCDLKRQMLFTECDERGHSVRACKLGIYIQTKKVVLVQGDSIGN